MIYHYDVLERIHLSKASVLCSSLFSRFLATYVWHLAIQLYTRFIFYLVFVPVCVFFHRHIRYHLPILVETCRQKKNNILYNIVLPGVAIFACLFLLLTEFWRRCGRCSWAYAPLLRHMALSAVFLDPGQDYHPKQKIIPIILLPEAL